MPTKPKRPCSHPGCPLLTDGQYCDEYRRETRSHYNRYQRDPESSKRYGRAWRRIRLRKLHAQPLCEQCIRGGRVTSADQVHHILPLSDGGTNDMGNLMSLCASCHSGITLGTNNAKRKW